MSTKNRYGNPHNGSTQKPPGVPTPNGLPAIHTGSHIKPYTSEGIQYAHNDSVPSSGVYGQIQNTAKCYFYTQIYNAGS